MNIPRNYHPLSVEASYRDGPLTSHTFPGQARAPKRLASTSCTYFRQYFQAMYQYIKDIGRFAPWFGLSSGELGSHWASSGILFHIVTSQA